MGCFSSKPHPEAAYTATVAAATEKLASSAPAEPVATAAAPIPRAKPVITEVDRAKHKLKHQRDVLEKHVRQSETVLKRDLLLARQLHSEGRVESAKVLLRRRRLVEKRVSLSVAQLDKIENSLSTIEGTESTASVIESIDSGTKALARLNALVNVERAEEIMRQSNDAIAYTEEVAAVLAGADDVPADDEIGEELAQIEKDAILAGAPAVPAIEPAAAAEEEVIDDEKSEGKVAIAA